MFAGDRDACVSRRRRQPRGTAPRRRRARPGNCRCHRSRSGRRPTAADRARLTLSSTVATQDRRRARPAARGQRPRARRVGGPGAAVGSARPAGLVTVRPDAVGGSLAVAAGGDHLYAVAAGAAGGAQTDRVAAGARVRDQSGDAAVTAQNAQLDRGGATGRVAQRDAPARRERRRSAASARARRSNAGPGGPPRRRPGPGILPVRQVRGVLPVPGILPGLGGRWRVRAGRRRRGAPVVARRRSGSRRRRWPPPRSGDELGGGRRAAVAAEAPAVGAGDGRDRARRRHPTHAVVVPCRRSGSRRRRSPPRPSGLASWAAVAGPPSPRAALPPVPATVVIVPAGDTCGTRWLSVSAIRKPPSAVDRHARTGRSAARRSPGRRRPTARRAVAGDGGDRPAGDDPAHAVVAVVGDQEAAVGGGAPPRRVAELGGGGRAAVAREPGVPLPATVVIVPPPRPGGSGGCRVGDQEAAVGGRGHPDRGVRAGRRSPGRRRRRARPCAGHRGDRPARRDPAHPVVDASAIRKPPSAVAATPPGQVSWAAVAGPPSPDSPSACRRP